MSEICDYKINNTYYCKSILYETELEMKFRTNIYKNKCKPQPALSYLRVTFLLFFTVHTHNHKINKK